MPALHNVRMISGVKRKPKKQRIAVFDFETEDWSKSFACGIMTQAGYKMIQRVRHIDELNDRVVEYLITYCKDTLVFSHNGGKFDILLLVRAIQKRKDCTAKFIMANGTVIAVIIELKNGQTISLYDSYRILQQPLAAIGAAIGIEKKEIDYEKIGDNEDWREYLYTDCLILFKAVEQLQTVLLEIGSTLKPTAASTAMETYLRNYIPETFRVEDDGGEWLRDYYAGGRVEVFKQGSVGKTLVFDVNSMYSHCMKKYKFPVGLPTEHYTELEKYFEQSGPSNDSRYVCFFDATVDIPASIGIPTLPFKNDGKLLFPIGKFRGYWDSFELHALRDACNDSGVSFSNVVELHSCKCYAAIDLFSEYVDTFYKLKSRGGLYAIAAKLFLNSLYGKFGEGRVKKSYIFNPDMEKLYAEIERPGSVGAINLEIPELNIWSVEVDRLPKHTSVPIAAHVTACARYTLYQFIREARKRGAEVYYCDTDSLFLSVGVFENSIELGGLKLEGAFENAIIFAPKMYCLTKPIRGMLESKCPKCKVKHDWADTVCPHCAAKLDSEKVRAKGFRKLSVKEFMDLIAPPDETGKRKTVKIRGGLGQFRSMLAETKRLIKSGKSKRMTKELDVWVADIDKGIQSDYTKRTVLADGNTTPLIMDNQKGWTGGKFKDFRQIAVEA